MKIWFKYILWFVVSHVWNYWFVVVGGVFSLCFSFISLDVLHSILMRKKMSHWQHMPNSLLRCSQRAHIKRTGLAPCGSRLIPAVFEQKLECVTMRFVFHSQTIWSPCVGNGVKCSVCSWFCTLPLHFKQNNHINFQVTINRWCW